MLHMYIKEVLFVNNLNKNLVPSEILLLKTFVLKFFMGKLNMKEKMSFLMFSRFFMEIFV